jgi:uncharacterized protein YfaQ (DUF2300 family)
MASLLIIALCLILNAARAATPQPAFEVLWFEGEGLMNWRTFDAAGRQIDAAMFHDPPIAPGAVSPDAPGHGLAPLGSLWKLLVYLWLVETDHPAPDYVCTGARGNSAAARALREEESYCCEPGQRIDRDTALMRSCAPFFSPRRLGIKADEWRKFWGNGGKWNAVGRISDLAAMKPETRVTPLELVSVLAGNTFGDTASKTRQARDQAANVLLARAFGPNRETDVIRHLGGRLRVKTFSWFRPDGSRYGGGAGWLIDGRPIWFAGEGTGQQVMARYAKTLAGVLDEAVEGALIPRTAFAPGCVKVRFFARDPLARVEKPGGATARTGVLRGHHVAVFANKVTLPFTANGELTLSMEKGKPRLDARLGLDDYVARVLDREGDARETEAARALAVVARSYLLNEARVEGNCLAIDDSSRKQRVSPNPPSAAARAAATFTSGLRLASAPVGFHSETPGENRMAWKTAVAASRAGQPWDRILQHAFPTADLVAMHDPAGVSCTPFIEAEAWLAAAALRWQGILERDLPGFEAPPAPKICRLAHGRPFSEQDRNRIHLHRLKSVEDRVTLAHEYLHLGLAHHPSGHDEALVEGWARKLIGEIHERK